MRGYLDIVDCLTEHAGPALLLQKDILGCTPVHLAAVQNQVTLIVKLVNALLKDESGATPLHVVARQRCMQVSWRCLLDAGVAQPEKQSSV
jgi:ankyrin repeat protein